MSEQLAPPQVVQIITCHRRTIELIGGAGIC